ncbi:MAG: hypothetical protein JW751_20565 [Polyangiaceae bacterium]|nr:hypothetical protein [Polyangiaceae bacterium]
MNAALQFHTDTPVVALRFHPVWTYVETAREFGRIFCERTLQDQDLAQRVRMVLGEILENAVKYSVADGESDVEVWLQFDGQRLIITCLSTPDPTHLLILRRELEHIRAFDPEAAYLAAFQRVAREPNAEAPLGLARMRHEGKFEVVLSEHGNGRIRLVATTRVNR